MRNATWYYSMAEIDSFFEQLNSYTFYMNHIHLFTVLAQTCQVCPPPPSAIESAVLDEITSRPLAGAQDIYKLIHQSVFGPGHIIQNEDSARNYLEKETSLLGPALPDERLYDELGGGMIRVNLRPFRDSNGSMEKLLRAMIETANDNAGTPEVMAERIKEARLLLEKQNKSELAETLMSLAEKQAANGYPAYHHSEAYRNAYKPAYRIIDRRFLETIKGKSTAMSGCRGIPVWVSKRASSLQSSCKNHSVLSSFCRTSANF